MKTKNTIKLILSWMALAMAASCGYTVAYFMINSLNVSNPVLIAIIIACAVSATILNFILYLKNALDFADNTNKINASIIVTLLAAATTGLFTCASMLAIQAPLINIILCSSSAFILSIFLLEFKPKETWNETKDLWSKSTKGPRALFILLSSVFITANIGYSVTTFDTIKSFLSDKLVHNKTLAIVITATILLGFILAEISFTIGIAGRISMEKSNNNNKCYKLISSILAMLNAFGNAFIAKKDWGGPAMAACGGILSFATMRDSINSFEINSPTARAYLGLSFASLASTLICAQANIRNANIWLPITVTLTALFGLMFIFNNKCVPSQDVKNSSDSSQLNHNEGSECGQGLSPTNGPVSSFD